MFQAFKHLQRQHHRGMTLVELMIVVAIVGILASIGGVALFRQIKRAKIAKMEAHTMNLARGQEELRSNHGVYLPTTPGPITATRDSDANLKKKIRNLISFNLDDLDPEMTVHLVAGEAGGGCTASPTTLCDGIDNTVNWYVVAVEMDLDGNPGTNTIVVRSSNNKNLRILNEGQ